MDLLEPIKIRRLERDDLEAIVEIDRATLGIERREYWEGKIGRHEEHSTLSSLVAERDGKVVGFLFGDAAGWEYGIPDTTGILEVIGVHPEFLNEGAGVLLVDEMVRNFRKVGVNRVYTFVNWRSSDLLGFFDSIGFQRGDMVNLELDLEPMGGAQ